MTRMEARVARTTRVADPEHLRVVSGRPWKPRRTGYRALARVAPRLSGTASPRRERPNPMALRHALRGLFCRGTRIDEAALARFLAGDASHETHEDELIRVDTTRSAR